MEVRVNCVLTFHFLLFCWFFPLYVFCVCVFCLHVCLCSMCMCGAHEGQKMAPDTLELERGITHHVGPGEQVLGIKARSVLCKSKCSRWARQRPAPTPCLTRVSLAVCVPQASQPQVPQDFPVSTSSPLANSPQESWGFRHTSPCSGVRNPRDLYQVQVTRLVQQAHIYTNPSPVPFLLWQHLTMSPRLTLKSIWNSG